MKAARRGSAASLAAWLVIGSGVGAAQPRPPRVEAVALDPVVARGPGVVVRLRLSSRDGATALTGARIVAARAVSSQGAVAPASGVAALGDGVYLVRAALETAGDWTIGVTVAVFDRALVTTAAVVRVVDDVAPTLQGAPTSPASTSASASDPASSVSASTRAAAPQN